jgi:hypothetical protein
VEAEDFDGILGAVGQHVDSSIAPLGRSSAERAMEAEEVIGAHMRLVDVEKEVQSNRQQFEDYDWVDDDIEEDIREADDNEWKDLEGDEWGQ